MTTHKLSVTAAIATGSYKSPFPLPSELIIQILEDDILEFEDRWRFARVSRSCYAFARRHVLFREIRLGWSYSLNFVRTARGLFNPKGMLAGRFESDVKFVREIGVGDLVREAYIGLETPANLDSPNGEKALSKAIRELTPSMPNLSSAKVFGTNKSELFQTTVNSLGESCDQLSALAIKWSWDRSPNYTLGDIDAAPGDFKFNFPGFPQTLRSLRLEFSADSGPTTSWDVVEKNFISNIMMPMLYSSLSTGRLRELQVGLFSDIPSGEQGIEWSKFRGTKNGSDLKVLTYQYVLGCGALGKIIDVPAMVDSFPHLEEISFELNAHFKIPHRVLEMLPKWFGKLEECRRLQIVSNIPSDPETDDSDEDDYEGENVDEAISSRKEMMTEIAQVMPKLEVFRWPHYCEGDRNNCEMRVERQTDGTIKVLKFDTAWEQSAETD